MPERTVRIGEMAYLDERGHWRRASHGATVKVHEDGVERFDRFNGDPHSPVPESPRGSALESEPPSAPVADQGPVEPEPEPEEPKRRGPGRPRKESA